MAGYLSGMWRMYQPKSDLDVKVNLVDDGYVVEVYAGKDRLLSMQYGYDQAENDPIMDFLAKLTKIVA